MVKIGTGDVLLSDATMPLLELMLTYHQYSPVTLIRGQFYKRYVIHSSQKLAWKLHISNLIQIFHVKLVENLLYKIWFKYSRENELIHKILKIIWKQV